MRCSCYKCENNEDGYCGCVDTIEVDDNGMCMDMLIRYDRDEEDDDK